MNVRLRLPEPLLARIRADLARPHPFAAERVGFVETALAVPEYDETAGAVVVATNYETVPDTHYVDDPLVGARIGTAAIRSAMQRALDAHRGCLHVHAHAGRGIPRLSATDARDLPRLVEAFRSVVPNEAHGVLLLSADEAAAWLWLPGEAAWCPADLVASVGRPMRMSVPSGWGGNLGDTDVPVPGRYDRQSFLGFHAQERLETVRLGVVGLGGGGSHVAQQALHLGFAQLVAFDDDTVEASNLNRLVGATRDDAVAALPKTSVVGRMADALLEHHGVITHRGRWEERPDLLASCDVVVGCVDSFAARRDLEAACRRALIPYIDIGMDVHRPDPTEPPRVAGQVIVSLPGAACMHCLGYLTEEKLAREAAAYTDAGGRPQVVFANGVLASVAIGLAVDMVTGWSGQDAKVEWRSYDGNRVSLTDDPRLAYLSGGPCLHYPLEEAGCPRWVVPGP